MLKTYDKFAKVSVSISLSFLFIVLVSFVGCGGGGSDTSSSSSSSDATGPSGPSVVGIWDWVEGQFSVTLNPDGTYTTSEGDGGAYVVSGNTISGSETGSNGTTTWSGTIPETIISGTKVNITVFEPDGSSYSETLIRR